MYPNPTAGVLNLQIKGFTPTYFHSRFSITLDSVFRKVMFRMKSVYCPLNHWRQGVIVCKLRVPSVSKLFFRSLKETKIPIHMKKFICSIIFLLCFVVAWAQSPNLMSYQAIIRNSANQLVVSSTLGVRVSLLQGSATGTVVFRETYTPNPMTNANGLLGLNIGSGVSIIGSFGQVS